MVKHTRSPHAGNPAGAPAPRASRDERFAAGKLLRDRVTREEHGTWKPPPVEKT